MWVGASTLNIHCSENVQGPERDNDSLQKGADWNQIRQVVIFQQWLIPLVAKSETDLSKKLEKKPTGPIHGQLENIG